MKKLYLLLLMLLLLFIPATHAVSPYQLDQPVPELNGYTLRELFRSTTPALENLVTNGDFSDGITGWTTLNIGTPSVSDGILSFTATAENGRIEQSKSFFANDIYYAIARYKANSNLVSFRSTDVTVGGTNTFHSGNGNYEVHRLTYKQTLTKSVLFRIVDLGSSGWTQIDVDYIMSFNLTDLFGVTSTSGTAYDNAVAKIEWLLSKNNGYIQTVGNPFEMVDLTVEEMETYYNLYLDAIRYVGVHDPTYKISTEFFLISTFFMYLLIMGVGYFTKNKYFYFAGALLWFVPLTNFSNIFIIVASAVVFTLHLIIIFYSDKDDVFE